MSISPDLKFVKIFVSILGDESSKSDMLIGFNAASSFLRRELASRLRIRYVPQLSFYYDESIERGERMIELITRVSNSK